ncbi:alpha/beta fold hydrolase [Nocardia sp. NPDC004604]|uniref:alpha/beta fold hydrolase n=1 Tax=Nocardia sp. NPDC004604 TaxID=3157013 RepID=UPI0033AEEEFD
MSTVVVSHGLEARSDSVWFPTFRAELEAAGHQVVIPDLPDSAAPKMKPWRETLAQAASRAPAQDTVLVGHSIGAVNVLRFLEQYDAASGVFAGVVLVSTSVHEVGYDLLAEFFEGGFDWPRIRAGAMRFRALAAIDDPVNAPNPLEHIGVLVRELGATAVVFPEGGHLGAYPEDHIELPEAARLVLDCLA